MSPIKEVLQLFLTKYNSSNERKNKLKGSLNRNVSTGPLRGTGRESLGIRESHF
jgi:hypothetical protein